MTDFIKSRLGGQVREGIESIPYLKTAVARISEVLSTGFLMENVDFNPTLKILTLTLKDPITGEFTQQTVDFTPLVGASYPVVSNYSTLPTGLPSGSLAYVENSQGTAWLPGSFGGTYYPSGFYSFNGTTWVQPTGEQMAKQFSDTIIDLNNKLNIYTFNNIIKNLIGWRKDFTNAVFVGGDPNNDLLEWDLVNDTNNDVIHFTHVYSNGNLISTTISGDIPSTVTLRTRTFNYDVNGNYLTNTDT